MFAEGSNPLPYSSKIAGSLSRPFLIINYTQYFSVDYLKYLFLNSIILNFLEAIIIIELSVCMKFFTYELLSKNCNRISNGNSE